MVCPKPIAPPAPPGDAQDAEQDQHKADLFRIGERFVQDDRCKQSDR